MVWVISRFRLKVETSSTRSQISINSDWTYEISSLEGTSSRYGVYKLDSQTASTSTHRVKLVRNLVAHGDAREGKWRGNWRMEWVTSTLTPPPNAVYPALLKLMRIPRLPAVDWTDDPTDLNGLVRFGERRNLVSARVPPRSARAIPCTLIAD